MESRGFEGLTVLSLESRRAPEMAKLIANFGGTPLVAPSMREVPLASNREALSFAADLVGGNVDVCIFLTGVGTKFLTRVVETAYTRDQFVSALNRTTVIARGPKPVGALRELGVNISITVPEPNTWREMLDAIDQRASSLPMAGKTVAIQEYGSTNQELLDGLIARGARVMRVPVYEWQLPEDLEPLRTAVRSIVTGKIDVLLFTTSVQVRHLILVAEDLRLKEELVRAAERCFVCSIGPVTSAELREQGFRIDFEPSHPKMGVLVKEAADHREEILARGKT
ncbi:MAG TPA: uroporphyrinogen-III synthase [Terriglobales bacterium]|nr:uroporphyrinogen-III synthase [Terriglobales bacterium]